MGHQTLGDLLLHLLLDGHCRARPSGAIGLFYGVQYVHQHPCALQFVSRSESEWEANIGTMMNHVDTRACLMTDPGRPIRIGSTGRPSTGT